MVGALIVDETKRMLAGVNEVILHQDNGDVVRSWVVHDVLLQRQTNRFDRLFSPCTML